VIAALPPTIKLTVFYFYGDVISKIFDALPFDLAALLRQLMLYMDNVTSH
jgi:hypothetical protein